MISFCHITTSARAVASSADAVASSADAVASSADAVASSADAVASSAHAVASSADAVATSADADRRLFTTMIDGAVCNCYNGHKCKLSVSGTGARVKIHFVSVD